MSLAHPSLAHHATHGALIVERTDLAALVVTGPDRLSWLQGMLTCDLAPVEKGHCVHGLVLDKQGKILADTIVLQQQDRILLAVDAATAVSLQAHLDHFLIMEDAEIALTEEPHTFVFVLGPRSNDVARAAGNQASAVAAGTVLGMDAALVFSTDGNRTALSSVLASADEDFAAATLEELHASRVELGIPFFGHDFGPANYPMEIGLDDYSISFSKGCYVGQEVVVKLRSRGKPVRVLRRLILAEGAALPPVHGVVALASGKEIGAVTSVGWSSAERALAFALLRRVDAEAADVVVVGGQEARITSAWGVLGTLEDA
jgi:hypothetical protein